MKTYAEEFRKAVEKTIQENHALGLPVYPCKEGYIIGLYPGVER